MTLIPLNYYISTDYNVPNKGRLNTKVGFQAKSCVELHLECALSAPRRSVVPRNSGLILILKPDLLLLVPEATIFPSDIHLHKVQGKLNILSDHEIAKGAWR